MDNITVVFVAFKNFERCIKNEPHAVSNSLNIESLNPHHYVVDEELMDEEDFPSKCVSDFNYIKGRCPTPPYLKPKPKGFISKLEVPTIITSNPEELTMDPPKPYPDFSNIEQNYNNYE